MRNVAQTNFTLMICSCSAVATALLAGASPAATIVVPTQQPTIQAGINAATNGDTVLVSNGTYTGPGNRNIDLMGKAITLRSMGGPANCTIDVKGTPQNQHTAFYLHLAETNATLIQGFTITGGYQFNGPAMLVFNSHPTIRNCVFTENHADCWGGAVYFDSNASPRFFDCKFVNNFSADDGGAIFGFNGSPLFSNCLIADNDGTFTGGAITIFGSGAPKLVNCTVTRNNAMWGAAIYSNNLIVENSIIFGNTGNQQIYTSGSVTLNVRFSNVQGGYAGPGNVNLQPMFAGAADGDFHLLPSSACIDAGDPGTVVPQGMLDFDGDPRHFGVRIDMGVDEYRKTGDVNGDHAVNVNDLLAVVGAWGPCTNHPADLNGDFVVNVVDLLTVVGNWG